MTGTTRRAGGFVEPGGEWVRHNGDTYRYPVTVTPTAAGFEAVTLTTQPHKATGPTEAAALDAIADLLLATIRAAKAGNGPRPRSLDAPDTAKWVIVSL